MTERSTPLVRPVPRRPFPASLSSPTPLPDFTDDRSSTPGFPTVPRFLQTFNNNDCDTPGTPSSPALSRPDSSFFDLRKVNLSLSLGTPVSSFTGSSTLGTIFSPSVTSTDKFFEDPQSLYETGSQTPTWRANVDDATYEVIKKRSNLRYQHEVSNGIDATTKPIDISSRHTQGLESSTDYETGFTEGNWFTSLSLSLRIAVLFTLGAVYGNILSNIHAAKVVGSSHTSANWIYLTIWGCVGVALGILLPWFDDTWDTIFGDDIKQCRPVNEDSSDIYDSDSLKEWILAIRSIATFIGIVFAIRRLPWDSTLQASISLALVNPFLWYVIDRSLPGFVLSTLMGTVGTVFLMGVNPTIMPAPLAPAKYVANHISLVHNYDGDDLMPYVLMTASVSTTETIVWMVSVLFCCALCFGNIGRRMALSQRAMTKGRWQAR